MKKLIAIILVASLFSFKTDKPLRVEGTIQQWQNVYQVIEQSNAPHLQVEAAKKFLLDQLQAQADTTKH